ncbi:CRISPR-associated protein Cas5h [Parapedobacter composti]|uniref:CRISPR-associated protein Cas5h n=1 Tax=Parapedobacter composti TaxID=623281 RepID=A0A1I1LKP3_9SPHI|nr:type I-B CRISPR-associated protein Cas5b [Parapedobacter composti]SFC73599.1 CRISPR-associated protein Cas5h [Parapedobacter composti]
MKLISFDLKADFGFFRKPDTNNTINLSYNIIHKPAVLGVLGAILGLEGYREKGKLPEYYERLHKLKIGVEPLEHDKGSYAKTNIKYSNTVGYANKGSNFLTEELTLISPQYRIYLLLDESNELQRKLEKYLSEAKAEYIPYFGKNEFSAWWEKESFREYSFQKVESKIADSIKIKTVFKKENVLKEHQETPVPDMLSFANMENPFMYFERLPNDFDLKLMQYNLSEYVYSTYLIKNSFNISDLYHLQDSDDYVQLL